MLIIYHINCFWLSTHFLERMRKIYNINKHKHMLYDDDDDEQIDSKFEFDQIGSDRIRTSYELVSFKRIVLIDGII